MAGSTTEAIKEKLDVVEFLKGYVTLQQAGRNWKGLCPFHKEKTASFMVSPERQSWHCFGCNTGGDVFAFLMRYENVEFGEALKILAEKAGVELRRLNPAEYKYTGLLYDLQNAAKEFFIEELKSAGRTRAYLAERGLQQGTIEEFEIGWASNEPERLTMHLLHKGYAPDDLLRAGLSFKTERGMTRDRFRGRIMFPIHNHFGKIVGFTGRILPELDTGEMGKYINSPETPIFAKSKLLYGFWKSKQGIRDAGKAFLVEGQMDFLMSWQSGIRCAVATSGTALTADHLRVLRRAAEELIVSFDSDEAGLEAGERAIDLAEANDFQVKVVTFRGAKDPAEVAAKDPVALLRGIAEATPAPAFYFERYLPPGTQFRPDRSFLKNLRAVLAKLKHIASPVAQSFWMKQLAERTGIEESALREEAAKLGDGAAPRDRAAVPETAPQRNFSRWELLSQRLLSIALVKNDMGIVYDHVVHLSPECQQVFEVIKGGGRRMDDPLLDELMNFVVLRAESAELPEIEEVKSHLVREYYRERRRELSAVVRDAEIRGDEKKVSEALRELGQLPSY